MSNSQRPHGLQPTRLLRPWDFSGKSTGVGCHCLLRQLVSRKWKDNLRDFAAGTVDKNLPANTGDTGLIPGLRRFRMLWSKQACVPQLLSLSSRALELQLKPACLEPILTMRGHCSEKPAQHNYSSPYSLQLEKACMQQRPRTATNKLLLKSL